MFRADRLEVSLVPYSYWPCLGVMKTTVVFFLFGSTGTIMPRLAVPDRVINGPS